MAVCQGIVSSRSKIMTMNVHIPGRRPGHQGRHHGSSPACCLPLHPSKVAQLIPSRRSGSWGIEEQQVRSFLCEGWLGHVAGLLTHNSYQGFMVVSKLQPANSTSGIVGPISQEDGRRSGSNTSVVAVQIIIPTATRSAAKDAASGAGHHGNASKYPSYSWE